MHSPIFRINQWWAKGTLRATKSSHTRAWQISQSSCLRRHWEGSLKPMCRFLYACKHHRCTVGANFHNQTGTENKKRNLNKANILACEMQYDSKTKPMHTHPFKWKTSLSRYCMEMALSSFLGWCMLLALLEEGCLLLLLSSSIFFPNYAFEE